MISLYGTTGQPDSNYSFPTRLTGAYCSLYRCTFHTPTFDYEGLGERYGNRAVGVGEEPYFDVHSKSRSEDLGRHV